MSNFLDNLKKAVDNGEFNSDAAKKIDEIGKLAEVLSANGVNVKKAVEERLENSGIRLVTDEDNAILEREFDKKLSAMNKEELLDKQLAMLIDIEDTVLLSIGDMLSHIQDLKENFGDKLENTKLNKKIEEIELKYKSFIN